MVIEIVWTFYLKSVPAKFQKYLKHISWVINGTSSSKLPCNPRHPSRNISCNHRHHLLQPSWRRIFSTSNYRKTRVDSDTNSDYKASSFDKLYIWRRKWNTAGFVRAHQRKYWNALTVGRGPQWWLYAKTEELTEILGLRSANERRRYTVTPSLIGLAKTLNQPWAYMHKWS